MGSSFGHFSHILKIEVHSEGQHQPMSLFLCLKVIKEKKGRNALIFRKKGSASKNYLYKHSGKFIGLNKINFQYLTSVN